MSTDFDVHDNIRECTEALMEIEGAVAASVVDCLSSRILGIALHDHKISIGNARMRALRDSDALLHQVSILCHDSCRDRIENMTLVAEDTISILWPLKSHPLTIIHLLLIRGAANLAAAQLRLDEIEPLILFDESDAGPASQGYMEPQSDDAATAAFDHV